MTVCIGVLCEERSAAILIADRMLTSGLQIEFEHPVSNKVTRLSDNCLALTAGDAFAFTELFNAVRADTWNRQFTPIEDFVEIIKDRYQALRRKKIVEQVLLPRSFSSFEDFYHSIRGLTEGISFSIYGEMERFNYGLDILVGGVTMDSAHLYTITDPGTSNCVDSVGFHAIGSGTNLAMSSLISSRCHDHLPLPDALMIAVDAKILAENAPGVGRSTDVSLIFPKGKAFQFSDDNVQRLKVLSQLRRDGNEAYQTEIPDMINKILSEGTEVPIAGKPSTIGAEMENSSEQQSTTTEANSSASGISIQDTGENQLGESGTSPESGSV